MRLQLPDAALYILSYSNLVLGPAFGIPLTTLMGLSYPVWVGIEYPGRVCASGTSGVGHPGRATFSQLNHFNLR